MSDDAKITPLRKSVLTWLAKQPGGEFNGEISVKGYEADDVLDEIFRMQREGFLTGTFPLNPNRRQGEDFGMVRLTSRGLQQVPPWLRYSEPV